MNLVNPNFDPESLSVFVNPPTLGDEYYLFRSKGFKVVEKVDNADIVVFTGGADINPALYGEKPHDRTHWIYERDKRELEIYRKSQGKFRVGICRGGQLLNVLSGGKLWQDVDNHHSAHDIKDVMTGQIVETTSIHHQAFRPGKGAIVLAVCRVSSRKEAMNERWFSTQAVPNHHWATDYEALFYPETRSLCLQGHPEMGGPTDGFVEYFHNLIARNYSLPSPLLTQLTQRIEVG